MAKGILWLGALGLLSSLASAGMPGDKARRECRALQDSIRAIHARMRQPYSARQGERYNEKLRKLRREWAKRCR